MKSAKESYNVLINTDKNFLLPTITMMFSLIKNVRKNVNINFLFPYVKDFELNANDIKKIEKVLRKRDKLIPFEIPKSCLIQTTKHNRWGYIIWLKICSLFYLPYYVDKLLYLDSDIIINRDISYLYNLDLNNYLFAGVVEEGCDNKRLLSLNIHDGNYVCSGVLLLNVNFIISTIKSVMNLKQMIELHNNLFTFPEQDFINYYFHDKILFIKERKYMFFTKLYKKRKKEKIVIFHYALNPRVWEPESTESHYMKHIFWKYGIWTFGCFYYIKIMLKSFKYFLSGNK